MRQALPGLIVGLLFGAGLALSAMINPARVLAFLDFSGHWDPTLAYVMAGAIAPAAAAFAYRKQMKQPLMAEEFRIPLNQTIGWKLVAGAAIFGIGWGLIGFCPGPAVAALAFGSWQPWLFVAAMLGGMLLHRVTEDMRRNPRRTHA
jgi:uncharacterized membrane protein YedE/YeeE